MMVFRIPKLNRDCSRLTRHMVRVPNAMDSVQNILVGKSRARNATVHDFGKKLHIYLGTDAVLRSARRTKIMKFPSHKILELTRFRSRKRRTFFRILNLLRKIKLRQSYRLVEIQYRLQFMKNVGIEYLTLDRRANTLSGGEAQRIRLASQLGSGLVGALYVLDEPTIGLHQRDNERLIETLLNLRDMGNTIIVVEHDEDTIFASDYIVDIGPKAGVHGGEVVVSGYLDELLTAPKNKSGSLTLAYLRGEERIEMPAKRRDSDKGKIKITGGHAFQYKKSKH